MSDDSKRVRLATLEIGESYLEGRRIVASQLEAGEIIVTAQRIYDTIKTAARRATTETGNQYTIERTATLIGEDGVLVVVAATRISGL